ncbi:DP-EP family protein [Gilvimarinus chinensis]|uniref:DP-EP family protein n=1 Tax=Gilvimarinus chinensis TaxID=396005 RepID=UPI00036612E4|nr:DP-EP family protein [Gilvimarinus chinensis]
MAKKNQTYDVVIPQGGAKIVSIELTPQQPKKGSAQTWSMNVVGKKKSFQNIVVGFDPQSDADDRRYEKAVLIFHLNQEDKNGQWRFIEEGLVYAPGKGDTLHDIETRVAQGGCELVLTIHNFDDSNEDVDFSFLAMYCDSQSGEVSIYASADPGIRVGRPPG